MKCFGRFKIILLDTMEPTEGVLWVTSNGTKEWFVKGEWLPFNKAIKNEK